MKELEYWNLKEKIGHREQVGKWYNTITELLVLYPAFENMTLTETRDYFYNRISELETEIRNKLNVE